MRSPKPRVCIITTVHHPRDDRIFHKQAASLVAAGYDVSLVGRWEDGMDCGPLRPLRVRWSGGKMARLIVGSWRSLGRALADRADVYHIHDPELLALGLVLRLLGKKVIYDVHEDYSKKILSRGFPAWLACGLSRVVRGVEYGCAMMLSHIIATDRHVAGLFPPAKTTIVANYPPIRFLRSKQPRREGVGDSPFRIVYVGGVSNARGIGKILDAMKLIENDGVEFHLAGNIRDDAIRGRVEALSKVKYHGVLPWEQVGNLLAECDVGMLVLQRLPAFEYYPGENIIKLWEYLGTGLPVIASDFPRLKTLIDDLGVGLAVDPGDARQIADAVLRFREDSALRRRMGENGKRWVQESRNWEKEAERLLDVYEKLQSTTRLITKLRG